MCAGMMKRGRGMVLGKIEDARGKNGECCRGSMRMWGLRMWGSMRMFGCSGQEWGSMIRVRIEDAARMI